MPYFSTQDDCSLYFETHGFDSTRPVVVFLNGTMQTTVNWKMHATIFEDRFRVLMYDARAQGQSDLGERKLSLEKHAEDFAELLGHLGVEKAHLVGLSHGAKVALTHAYHSPEQVDRLVLCSVSAIFTSRAKLFVRSWLEILRSSGLEAMAWVALPVLFGESFLGHQERILDSMVKAIVNRNTKEALVAQLEAMTTYPPLSEIARNVRNPCLVISASDDPLVTEEGAKELAVLCGGHHEHIAGVGHSIPTEAPELFVETVIRFLDTT
ncbi:MAG: alpha/beta fold hydrolase [Deltaproteobacteria bacterium]|nr:alpha/beta fold hydrolase [Deltaproteobacteria bacterium]